MEFSSREVLAKFLAIGLLLHFAPNSLFRTDKWHYGVVLSNDWTATDSIVVAVATSDGLRRQQIAVNKHQDPKTVVPIPRGAHPKFDHSQTGFDGNHPYHIGMDKLVCLYESVQVKIPRNDYMLDEQYVRSISEGVCLSKLVQPNVKAMVDPK